MRTLLDLFDAAAVTLDVEQTPRNGPVQEFVVALGLGMPERGIVRIERGEFDRLAPALVVVVRSAEQGAQVATASA